MVGVDGISRVLDFGIAKAVDRIQDTHTGQLKGKVSYMAPEQILGQPFDRRVDIYAAGLVLWEALAGKRLFQGDSSGQIMYRVLREEIPRLPLVAAPIADAVARAIARDPASRFATAFEFARALEEASEPVAPTAIGDWVREVSGPALSQRLERLLVIEATPVTVAKGGSDARSRGRPRASRVVALALAGCVVVAATSALALRPHHKGKAAAEPHDEGTATPVTSSAPPTAVAPESESAPTLLAGDQSSKEGTRTKASSPSSPSSDRGASNPQPSPQDGARSNANAKKASPKGSAARPALRRAEDLFSRE
jgi:serine/threonine-protein kinase